MENYVNNMAIRHLQSHGITEIAVEDPLDISIPKILISIKPNYCELIASGKKTLELRKNKPKINTPFKCYIYCTKDKHNNGNKCGKVIGEFVCDSIIEYQAEFHKGDDTYQDIQKVWIDEDYPEDGKHYQRVTANDEDEPNNCDLCLKSCLSFADIKNYIGEESFFETFFSWHISFLKIYKEPKELNEFVCNGKAINRPPQSWCYIG